ncbi:MAG: DNA translocase FtsK 4TM domain-containing protein [Desulfovibrio sp.]|jgi:DNA segregation ATPase FtsK/SpoIIIE-like protein|nr:DNA translocase FtsK 4TM domain-containing protein [Desulfovibrio sp.]
MKAGGAKNILYADDGRLGRDLLGLFSIFFAILLILSLASFDGRDPWLNHVVGGSQNIRNKTGLFGAYTAGFLYDVFGTAAWVLPVFLSTAGARRILSAAPWPCRRWCGFIFPALCIGIAGAAGDLGDIGLFARGALPAGSGNVSSHGGGLVGHMLYVWLLGWLGSTGTFLVWLFTLLSSVQVLSGISLPLLAYTVCAALKRRLAATLRAAAARRGAAPAGADRQTGNTSPGGVEPALRHTVDGSALAARAAAPAREDAGSQRPAAPAGDFSFGLSAHAGYTLRLPGAGSNPEDLSAAPTEYAEQQTRPVVRGLSVEEASSVREDVSEYRIPPEPARLREEEPDAYRAQGPEMPELPPMPAHGALEDDEDIPPWVYDFEHGRVGLPPFSSIPAGRASAFDRQAHGEMHDSGSDPAEGVPAEERPVALALPGSGAAEMSSITFDFPDRDRTAEDAPDPAPTDGVSAAESPWEREEPSDGRAEISSFTFDFPARTHREDDFRSLPSADGAPIEERPGELVLPSGARSEPADIIFDFPDRVRKAEDAPDLPQPSTPPPPPVKNEPAGTALSRPDLRGPEIPLPPLDILEAAASPSCGIQRDVLEQKGRNLMNCLHDFGIQGELAAITPGPVVTMFEIKPAPGVRVARIAGLSDDLALALKAPAVRIQAPVPGTDAVGIEIPNVVRETVCLKELLSSSVFRQSPSLLTLALGKDTAGNPVTADLASMPHLLVAGATGAGKSVGINSIILSILYKARPDQVKLLLVDPKRVEMSIYADLPHLVHPVVTEMPLAKSALEWAVSEMERRYDSIAGAGVRNITDYNARIASWGANPPPGMEDVTPIPFLVLIIDELADLMLVASKEVETSIVRLAQLARAAGIHLILATQRPSVDVVTGLIKANFPCRMAFQVTSKHDSRTILDTVGAEHLLGKGDMLFKPAGGKFRRLHGAFVSDRNVNAVVDYWKALQRPDYLIDFADWGQEGSGPASVGGGVMDINAEPLYNEAVEFVRSQGKASISLIQRKFRIGFNKAARYVEQMEADGIIGPADGSKPRPVIK